MRIVLIVVGSVIGLGVLLLLVGLVVARLRTPSADEVRVGIADGRFVPCPKTPNCVSTMATDAGHRIEAIPYRGTGEQAIKAARAALESLPRTRLLEEEANYLRAEARTLIFRFVDDVEIYVPAGEGLIHYRSASRVGQGDVGTNRKRYERFRELVNRSLQ
jgi:uncharacterized protein (DUF1499 family)